MEISVAEEPISATRERSTIRFPYGDLEDAITVAATILHSRGRSCALDELAHDLGQTISGAFRTKVASAATFGAIETSRGLVTLTDLGSRLADERTRTQASSEAFLTVPLFKAVYDRFRGARLPGDQGLESEMVKLGVSPKVADKARQSLYRSAEQAGFLGSGRDRLVAPALGTIAGVQTGAIGAAEEHDTAGSMRPGGLDPAPAHVLANRHPLLVGLWDELPDPKLGTLSAEKQAQWIETAKVILKLLYGNGTSATPTT